MSSHSQSTWLDRYWIALVILFAIAFVTVLVSFNPHV